MKVDRVFPIHASLYGRRVAGALLVILIVVQVGAVFAFAAHKDSFFIDELYSYGLANSTAGPFLRYDSGFFDQWHDDAYFQAYLTVSEGEAFSYAAVYRNQVLDVHPPLYYFCLHTICSFFPGVFSKWFGIGLNLVFLVISQILLYLIARRLLIQPLQALLPGLIWGSLAAVNSALFIRMYLMLTLMALLLVYLHVLMAEKGLTVRRLAVTGLILALGLLTHYYLIILAFLLGLAFVAHLLWGRRWKQCLAYCGTLLAGAGLFLAIYPAVFQHLFGDARVGSMTRNNLLAFGQLPVRLFRYSRKALQDLFGQADRSILLLLALALVLILALALIQAVRHHRAAAASTPDTEVGNARPQTDRRIPYGLALLFIVTATFAVIAQISVVIESRYLYFLYPLISLGLVLLLSIVASRTFRHPGTALAIMVLVCLAVAALAATTGKLDYLYSGRTAMRHQLETQYSDCDCLFLTEYSSPPSQELMELMTFRGVYITGRSSIPRLSSILAGRSRSAGLIVMVDINPFWSSGYDADAVIGEILASGLFDTSDELYQHGLVRAYHLQERDAHE